MINSFFSIFLLQEKAQSWLFASEKVNAVLAVVLVIFVGFISYLFISQRKVSQLEKQMDQLENEK
ncbi:MAG: CcmD family protein [Bacteroidia bacterium]|nr:CcmD family protein [Bacteroidia bacterium]